MIKDENNLASLIAMKELGAPITEQEQSILDYYNKHIPVLDTDCEMNRICHYIESVDFNIKQKVKSSENFDYTLLTSPNFTLNSILYSQIKDLVTTTINSWQSNFNAQNLYKSFTARSDENSHSQEKAFRYEALQNDLLALCSNTESLANHLVYLFYVDKPSLNKSNLWKIAGEWIYENVKKRKFNSSNSFAIDFPIKDPNGSLKYLYENYQITNITITKEEEDG